MSGLSTNPAPIEVNETADTGIVSGYSIGTFVTTSSAANTMGAWTELVSGFSFDTNWMMVAVGGSQQYGVIGAADIGIGPNSGSVNAIANYLVESFADGYNAQQYSFPVNIPSGTPIWARAQSASGVAGGDTVEVHVQCYASPFQVPEGNGLDTYGFIASTTSGTAVNPGSTANQKGSWVEIASGSGLVNDIIGFMIGLDKGNPNVTTGADAGIYFLDIGIGPTSGAIQTILGNFRFDKLVGGGATEGGDTIGIMPNVTPIVFTPLPAGTVVWARMQSSVTNSTYRANNVTLYGIRA